MKPSGVAWLGDVPAHWGLPQIKHLVYLKSGESITSEQIEEAGQFPVYGGNGLRGYTAAYTHDGDFVLIGRQGALCGNINYATGRFYASEHAVVAKPLVQCNTRWLGELLRSMNLNQYSIAAAQPGLSVERIRELRLPEPPVEEQNAIAAFIDTETSQIDHVAARTRREIDLIREYRTRLIADVVTGQLDVRAAASALPDIEPDAALSPIELDADDPGLDLLDEEIPPDEDADAAD